MRVVLSQGDCSIRVYLNFYCTQDNRATGNMYQLPCTLSVGSSTKNNANYNGTLHAFLNGWHSTSQDYLSLYCRHQLIGYGVHV